MKRGGLKLMVSAGDASGDQHAAAVLQALCTLEPGLQAFGLGGPALQAAGLRLDVDLVSRSVIGLVEVLKGLGFYRQALAKAERLAAEEDPDLVLLVDSSGFNLRLAERLQGRAIVYYICPQVWASRAGRLKVMARTLRKALYTFPFERALYEGAGIPSRFMGNPLLDAIPEALLQRGTEDPSPERQRRLRSESGLALDGPLLGLLPGSRQQEVRTLLPVMLAAAAKTAAQVPGLRCVVVKAPGAPLELYAPVDRARAAGLDVALFEGRDAAKAYAARAACDAALVASGTATLETALLGVPFSVLYKVHPLTFAIGKRLVTLPYIGLANVVAGRQVVPEFLQGGLKPDAIAAEAVAQLTDPRRRGAQREGLAEGLSGLGEAGVAARVAQELQALLSEGTVHAAR